MPNKKNAVYLSLKKDKSGSYLSSMKLESSRKKMKAAIDAVNKNNLPILDELI